MTDKKDKSITLPGKGTRYVCVNGKSYLIPEGKSVTVPHAVYTELKRAMKAEESFDSTALALRFAK